MRAAAHIDSYRYSLIKEVHPFPFSQTKLDKETRHIHRLSCDPLSFRQMGLIKSFFDYFLFQTKRLHNKTKARTYQHIPTFGAMTDQKALSGLLKYRNRKMDTICLKNLKNRRQPHKKPLSNTEEFSFVQSIVQNPVLLSKEFELNPRNKTQLYAASKFMRSILSIPPKKQKPNDIADAYARYKAKMFNPEGNGVKKRHVLLIDKDPLYLPSETTDFPEHLKRILERVYFCNIKGEKRAKTRNQYLNLFKTITSHEEVSWIIKALSLTLKKKDGRILISDDPENVDTLRNKPSKKNKNNNETIAWCCYEKSEIQLCSLIIKDQLSDLIHEATHFIMETLFNDWQGQAVTDKRVVRMLDRAIELDRAYQKDQGIESLMDDVSYYFPTGFQKNNPNHLSIMRNESLAFGAEELFKDPIKFATDNPHLSKFFETTLKPLVRKHTKMRFGADVFLKEN